LDGARPTVSVQARFGQSFIRFSDAEPTLPREDGGHLTKQVHLLMFYRQNMEKVHSSALSTWVEFGFVASKARNLCYMLERREKLKRQLYATALEHVRQLQLLSQQCVKDQKASVLRTNHRDNIGQRRSGLWASRAHLDFYRLKPVKWRPATSPDSPKARSG